MKAYFLGGLDGGFGQALRQPAQHADVVDAPVGAEDDGQHNSALDFVQTGLFGAFGFFTVENRRFQCFGHYGYIGARACSGAAARTIEAVADIASFAGPVARAFTLSDSGSRAGAA